MAEPLNRTVSDFIRVCDELLSEPRPSLTTEELDILDGYIKELIERFFSPPHRAQCDPMSDFWSRKQSFVQQSETSVIMIDT